MDHFKVIIFFNNAKGFREIDSLMFLALAVEVFLAFTILINPRFQMAQLHARRHIAGLTGKQNDRQRWWPSCTKSFSGKAPAMSGESRIAATEIYMLFQLSIPSPVCHHLRAFGCNFQGLIPSRKPITMADQRDKIQSHVL
ncbi:hypothetical protein NC651_001899 [Populus alba x Populus x berolinensis]|uniref:Uncharacterized protein n=1 Tax=Populus davidiana TaxID=266767 RepID=A0A6M2EL82_9ROSI|nr:hypothetical protein NC651_001899 [Populus alba x Populus x berolinensis]